jgi:predicted MFS family arabinose efflux permease
VAHKESIIAETRQGIFWILENKFARMAIVSFSLGTLIFQALIMVFLDDAQNRHLSSLAIGVMLAASGIGGAVGSLMAPRLPVRAKYSWMRIQAGIWFAGFALLVLPIGQQFFFTATVMAILGVTGALGNIALNTHLMQNSDLEMLARVTSVSRLASLAAAAIGPIMGGTLVQEFGAQHAMLCLFCLTPALLLLSALTPPVSRRTTNHRSGGDRPSRMAQGTMLSC